MNDSNLCKLAGSSVKIQQLRYFQVGVSIYGGGIWRTWFDRDLSVAGEIVLRGNESGALRRKLVNVKKPILFIPNLAIHLETDRNTFSCNTETNLRPVLESYAAAGLNCPPKKCEDNNPDTPVDPRSVVNEHHSTFLKLISEAAECKPEDIVDMDLYLYDANPAAIGGVHEEFICGARLDNLVGTYTAIRGLIESLQDEVGFENERLIRMAACFDNEEVGSSSAMGAGTSFTEYVLRRICTCLNSNDPESFFEQAIGNSMLISADQAHAAHPNYSDKHEQNHRPCFHGGVVVKVNVNQRYATTPTTHAILKEVAAAAGVPLQKMIVRNDSPCGSTVGPILATALGLQTVDVGCPQLAMHSIREFPDTSSIYFATKLYSTFHARLNAIMGQLIYSETA
ncbi:hypothetical protein WR25_11197 [Diploscapter pachys]|uniref:Aspartyl aminopeptidase n=1 Tax=Diploscapter pachys TaxID=2018661 RepID=A0A2A2LTZ4_9BILA|nr:hypothetical protein WR25_11197 [Diploscapter pachys]